MTAEVWVKRLMTMNALQLIINTGLVFVLAVWFLILPSQTPTQRAQQWSQARSSGGGAEHGMTVHTDAAPGQVDSWQVPAPPAGEDEELPAPGGAPGGAAAQGGAGMPATAVSEYLETAIERLRQAADKKGDDVSDYLPSGEEEMAAAATGDFFNPKTLKVLRKLRRGFEAVGSEMPPIPEDLPPGGL